MLSATAAWGEGAARGDDKAECIALSEEAQSLAVQHRLVEARERFTRCVRDVCPAAILEDCAAQVRRLDEAVPTVVLVAVGSDGGALTDVHVSMDGVEVASALDGRAIALNPGMHRLVFTAADGRARTVEALVEEGAKLKRITASFVVPTRKGPAPALALALGGLGVVSLGVGVGLGADVLAERNSLYTTSERDAFLVKEHVVDVAFGVGVVSLAVATWLFVARPQATPPAGAAATQGGAGPRVAF